MPVVGKRSSQREKSEILAWLKSFLFRLSLTPGIYSVAVDWVVSAEDIFHRMLRSVEYFLLLFCLLSRVRHAIFVPFGFVLLFFFLFILLSTFSFFLSLCLSVTLLSPLLSHFYHLLGYDHYKMSCGVSVVCWPAIWLSVPLTQHPHPLAFILDLFVRLCLPHCSLSGMPFVLQPYFLLPYFGQFVYSVQMHPVGDLLLITATIQIITLDIKGTIAVYIGGFVILQRSSNRYDCDFCYYHHHYC